jgi:hypothetical protein
LFYSYTGSEHEKISSSIASPFCYPIKLQIFLLLPLSIYPKRGLGALKKKETEERKRTNVPT